MQNQENNKLLTTKQRETVKVPRGHSPLILSSCGVYGGAKAFEGEDETNSTEGFFV